MSGPGMENPLLRSGVLLAGFKTWLKGGSLPAEAEDGLLTAEDVSGLDLLATELVVLSACETGLGEVRTGEGVFGLRRAFVLAGAKTLVMSLWKAPDEQTRELMEDFYRRILRGEPRAEALRQAQLEMKKKYPDPYKYGGQDQMKTRLTKAQKLRTKPAAKAASPTVTLADVEVYLARQSKAHLLELLLEQVKTDAALRERLLRKAARTAAKGLDLAVYRKAIFNAVAPDDYVSYREMWDYTSGIDEVVASLEDLLEEGYAAEVIELAEYALKEVEEAMQAVDDSAGQMGGILHRLKELHHAACKRAKPEPEALAEKLFAWELESDWETFLGAAQEYADVMGKRGLARYRALAAAAWAQVPALAPGNKEDYSGKRFRLTSMMEALAREAGDLEALVAVKSRNLSLAYHFLQIAEAYREAKRYDQALAWAERGVQAFPTRTDARLRDFLAAEYHRRNRREEAMALIWAQFIESNSYLQNYQKLKQHADRCGVWPQWREQALAYVRRRMTKAEKNPSANSWGWRLQPGYSELVSIFLWEKDVEAAWREAQAGGCTNDLWLELAAAREKDHPEDALPIYQRQIEPLINLKDNQAYAQAAKYVGKLRELLRRLGREAEFATYLANLRKTHKPTAVFNCVGPANGGAGFQPAAYGLMGQVGNLPHNARN